MSLYDFLTDTVERYREQSLARATRGTASAFYRGVVKRTADPYLGRPIWERGEWDVAVVLDACRVDLMREVLEQRHRPGLEPDPCRGVWSPASCSIDWIQRHFAPDIEPAQSAGYVTANPFSGHDADSARSADLREGVDVGYLDEVWRDRWRDIGGIETVPPEDMTERAIDAWRRRDELGIDRLVVHYMQPHQPFRARPEWSPDRKNLANLVDPDREAGPCHWQRFRHGELDATEAELWAAYRDNLRWVLDDVTDRLLENVDARVAITSDHGNGMGEWGVWAHPPASIAPPVRRVPWLELDAVDTRTVEPDVEASSADPDAVDDIGDRLEELGYL